MKYDPIDKELFRLNRANLRKLLPPGSLAVVNANDIPPVNGDAVLALRQNSDLLYLTGIEQEETLLLLCPGAHEPKQREILFLRRPDPLLETWEGRKLTREEAREISGVAQVEWLPDFPPLFHRLI
ncbi:MAG: aminopeptidase P N-terminal domain-containing protein, partial [Acidobacteriaceae bacterium]